MNVKNSILSEIYETDTIKNSSQIIIKNLFYLLKKQRFFIGK